MKLCFGRLRPPGSVVLGLLATAAGAAAGDWAYRADLSAKETFDSNVFIQDHGSLAKKASAVSSVTPSLGVTYKPGPVFNAAFSYAPEVTYYLAEPSENYVAHRGNLNFNGKSGQTSWDWLNGVVWIDGNRLGPRFLNGGDVPAIGGVPLRDRRAAAVYRDAFKVTQTFGSFFVRPVFSSYDHDFQTEHHARVGSYTGYENYIDRYELSGGVDLGAKIFDHTWAVLGYRYGHQGQKRFLGVASPYSNDFQRFLAGVEGTPTSWLKLSLLGGPDVRDFGHHPAVGFDAGKVVFYVDASAVVTLSTNDTVTLKAATYEQPAFSSQSAYQDTKYDLSCRHQFGSRVSAAVGFTLYIGDWRAPVLRQDWIYTPSASLSYAFNSHLGGELAYSYDWVESQVPNTLGREFRRHLVSASVKYTF